MEGAFSQHVVDLVVVEGDVDQVVWVLAESAFNYMSSGSRLPGSKPVSLKNLGLQAAVALRTSR